MKTYFIYKLKSSEGQTVIYLSDKILHRKVSIKLFKEHDDYFGDSYRTEIKNLTRYKVYYNYWENRQLRAYLPQKNWHSRIREYMKDSFNRREHAPIIKTLLKDENLKKISDSQILTGLEQDFLIELLRDQIDSSDLDLLNLFTGAKLVGKISTESKLEQKTLDILSRSSDDEFENYFSNPKNKVAIGHMANRLSKFLPMTLIHQNLYGNALKNINSLIDLCNWYNNQAEYNYLAQPRHTFFNKRANKQFTQAQRDITVLAADKLKEMITTKKNKGEIPYSIEEYRLLLESDLLSDIKKLNLFEFDFTASMPSHINAIVQWYDNQPKFVTEHRHPFWDTLTHKKYTNTNMRILHSAMEKLEDAISINRDLSSKELGELQASSLYKDLKRNFKERLGLFESHLNLVEKPGWIYHPSAPTPYI